MIDVIAVHCLSLHTTSAFMQEEKKRIRENLNLEFPVLKFPFL
jgi:hypothetical protein